jgi:paraquat-inducible protein B
VSKRASSTLIGAFVITAIALAISAFLLLGNVALFKDSQKAIMYFTGSVEGLQKGAPVNVRGVKIGTVIDIDVKFHPLDGEFFIPVIVQFEPDAVEIVRQLQLPDPKEDRLKYMVEELGLRAQLHLQSILTAQMAIQLDYHPNTRAQYLGDGELPEIPTIPMTIEKFNEEFKKLPIEQILNDITSSLSAINQIVSSPDIIQTINMLKQTLQTVDKLAKNIDRNIQPIADNTTKTLLDLQHTLQEANAILLNTKQLLSEDSTQIYNLNMALEEIVNAARSIRMFAETIERQPETLFRGKNPRD